MDRHQPHVARFTLTPGAQVVYVPTSAPREIEVTILNVGPGEALIKFHADQEALPVPAGSSARGNPSHQITAYSDAGCDVIVATGVSVFNAGVASTATPTNTELAAIAESRTQKELLVDLLLQSRLTNLYLSEMQGEVFRISDLD